MNCISRLFIVANVKNLFTLPFKTVTKQIPNMHIRSRQVLVELTAVHLLTEAVSFFAGVAKEIKVLPDFPLPPSSLDIVSQIQNQLLLI